MASPMLSGQDIQRILQEKGNIVQAVILRCPPTPEGASTNDSKNSNDKESEEITASGNGSANCDVKGDSNKDDTATELSAPKETPQDGKDVPSTSISTSADGSSSTTAEPKFSEGTFCQSLEQFIEQVEIDTTPKERAVATLLTGDASGQITFLGQYEDENVVVIANRESTSEANDDTGDTETDKNSKLLPFNPHKLQPPLHKLSGTVRGDILLMRVQPNEEEEEELQDDDDNNNEKEKTDEQPEGSGEDEQSQAKSDGPDTSIVLDDVVSEFNQNKATAAGDALKKAAVLESFNVSELTVEKPETETVKAETDNTKAEADVANTDTDTAKTDNTTEEENTPAVNGAVEAKDDAEEEEEEATFFQSYSKDEYLIFAKRTDILIPADVDEEEVSDQEEAEIEGEESNGNGDGDDDEEEDDEYNPEDDDEMEEESPMGMFHMVLGHLIRQFQEQNDRGPRSSELLRMRALLADRMGIELEGAAAIVLTDLEDDEDTSDSDGEASDSSKKEDEATGAQNSGATSQSPARVSKKRRREEDDGGGEEVSDAVAGPAKKRHRKRIQWNKTLTHVQEIPANSASSDEEEDEETETENELDVSHDTQESSFSEDAAVEHAYQLKSDEQEV